MKLGIQLYSVRDRLEKDFSGTMQAVKDLGVEGVEFAGNYGKMEAGALAAYLRKMGLLCCGFHVGLKDLNDVTSLAYQYAKAVGAPCMTTSCCAQDELANWDRTIATLAAAGKVAATQGIRFTYHNHAPELQVVNGQTLLDRLYARTDAATVKAELDTAWVYAGGGDPVACIRRYPGRVPQIHAKDYSKASRKLVEIGRGDLDFEAIVAAGREAKTEWLIYELDASTIGDSLASARESLPRLKKLLG